MEWRKASFSGSGGDCVEVRQGLTAVRDSKNPSGPVVVLDLANLVSAAKSGTLDRR
ncbi:DUF397 domain-containing protein [Actinokineospora pegani]|uniref:DUF397 domain-containing protein n=1 Tax=Actinokineospora pegani TaxID=2654637 RepID=UPI0012EAF6E8|nr:DUF397 domain-containing protein [Actinokineospora pegani]